MCRRTGLPGGQPFGPVYKNDPESDATRYQVLRDQLEIYQQHNASWAIWTYKDIGLQGVVYAASDSPWMGRVRPIVEQKNHLGTGAWVRRTPAIQQVIPPIEELFEKQSPSYEPSPFGVRRHVTQLVRHLLLSEAMLDEWAEQFCGVTADHID